MDWKQTAARGLGWLTTLPYRAQPRVTIGPRLLGNGRLRISGPGRVMLEADVNAWSHAEVNRLVTTRQQAVIHVGQNARLNGCTIIAADRWRWAPTASSGRARSAIISPTPSPRR